MLFFTFVFLSCSENNDPAVIDIKGNWSYIDLNEEYYEVLIDSFNMVFYNESAGFLQIRNYKLKNDSLFIYLPDKLNLTKPYRFNLVGTKVYLSDIMDSSDTLIRIKRIDTSEFTFDKIKDFENEELKFNVAYNNRKNTIFKIGIKYDLDSIIKERKSEKPIKIMELKKPKSIDDKY